MLAGQNHIIRRLVLRLSFEGDSRSFFQQQAEIKQLVLERIMPELDGILSSIIPEDQIVSIKSLELDLGEVLPQQFKSQLINQLSSRITEFYRGTNEELRSKSNSPSPTFTSYSANLNSSAIFPSGDRSLSLFYHFLKHGNFPWWAKNVEWKQWENELIAQLEKKYSQHTFHSVLEVLTNQKQPRKRLLEQFSPSFLTVFFEYLRSEYAKYDSDCESITFSPQGSGSIPKKLLVQKYGQLFQLLEQLTFSGEKENISPNYFTQAPESMERIALDAVNNGSIHYPSNFNHRRIPEGQHTLETNDWELLVGNGLRDIEQEEAYFIENAGMALVLNSVQFLYQKLGYLNSQKLFTNPKKKLRALHLLHYICFGTTRPYEPECVLNKIACEWPLNSPVSRNIRLTQKEKQTTEEFLQAIIEQWGALKKASNESLRHNFLIRQGKLSFQQGHWLLQVEKTPYDPILLAKYPWPVSIIKSTWMNQRIHVAWID